MNENRPDSEIESRLADALSQEPETWTPACLSPELIIALAERTAPENEAARQMAHVALCARCRREYAETAELIQLMGEVRGLEGSAARAATPVAAPTPPGVVDEPASSAVASREGWHRRPWPKWLMPGLGFAAGAGVAALALYFMNVAPSAVERQRLASTLAEQAALRARLEQDLSDLKRREAGRASDLAREVDRLSTRVKAQNLRMARLEQDADAIREIPLPAPAWLHPSDAGPVRGGGTEGHPHAEIALIAPVNTAIWSRAPVLEARPAAGAADFQLSLEMAESTEEVAAPKPLGASRWQVVKPLKQGTVYEWAVSATRNGQPIRSLLAHFYVLTEAERATIEKARKLHAQNPLALGAVYARLGMRVEAEQQLRAALKADPTQPVARRWLDELAQAGGSD